MSDLTSIEALNQADIYRDSFWDYIIETQHGAYPIGTYTFLRGFKFYDDALKDLKMLEKSSPGQIRLVNKRRTVLVSAVT
ncbi:MAG TPA: hypothetical protein VK211_23460 [Kamptonema sp.]|nr:hypothetical protein [Kamptonema sp.]